MPWQGPDAPDGGLRRRGTFRHKNGGANLAFLDGHSKYIPTDPEFGYVDQDANGCFDKRYFAWDK